MKSTGSRFDVFSETVVEMLSKWDAGENIWSVEMGGLGPGYEQAIQILAMELCRSFEVIPRMLWDDESRHEEFLAVIKGRTDEVMHDLWPNKDSGYSGAQVFSAVSLACKYVNVGPRKAVGNLNDPNRHIQVNRNFPKSPRKYVSDSDEPETVINW